MFSQRVDRSLIMNVGCSDNGDLSTLFGGRFIKNTYGVLEYSGNQHQNKKNMLIGLGTGTKRAIVLVKGGVCYQQVFDIPPTQHPNSGQIFPSEMKSKFDFGLEYLWVNDNEGKITFLYGLSATRMNGLELKLGLAF